MEVIILENVLEVLRTENKYIVNKNLTEILRVDLKKILTQDENVKKDGYMVRSLYFDTINNKDYMTKLAGVEERRKIRLRIYSLENTQCKLEVKEKHGNLQRKVSLWISKEDAIELSHLNYSVLLNYADKSIDALRIYNWMLQGVYVPVVLIEYDRVAFTYPLNSTRITLDCNVRSTEANLDLFSKKPGYNILMSEYDVLEVKYNQHLMSFISDSLKKYDLTQVSVSKYCLGRKVFSDYNF